MGTLLPPFFLSVPAIISVYVLAAYVLLLSLLGRVKSAYEYSACTVPCIKAVRSGFECPAKMRHV